MSTSCVASQVLANPRPARLGPTASRVSSPLFPISSFLTILPLRPFANTTSCLNSYVRNQSESPSSPCLFSAGSFAASSWPQFPHCLLSPASQAISGVSLPEVHPTAVRSIGLAMALFLQISMSIWPIQWTISHPSDSSVSRARDLFGFVGLLSHA
jgi:hypothetical protein